MGDIERSLGLVVGGRGGGGVFFSGFGGGHGGSMLRDDRIWERGGMGRDNSDGELEGGGR
jgi:hypothetical protein